MNIFPIHSGIIEDYKSYIKSFLLIKDKKIRKTVDENLEEGRLWPEPLIQFNPTFEKGTSVSDLANKGIVDKRLNDVFKGYDLYKHQVEAIQQGTAGKSFIVTSGTGSGKSLTFLATIFSDLLKNTYPEGIKAILVYPMNALINSQEEEIKKYAENYHKNTGEQFPITFSKYTGQEGGEIREGIKKNPPDILLTNYMMLELLMTRASERGLRESIFSNLQYLIFDELHTYRGRQGADVSLLIRRIHAKCIHNIRCIGTSATMASGGSRKEQKEAVAKVGTQVFDKEFTEDQIIGEYLENTTAKSEISNQEVLSSIQVGIDTEKDADTFISHPLAIWIENNIALKKLSDGFTERGKPLPLSKITEELCSQVGCTKDDGQKAIEQFLVWAENLNEKEHSKENRKSYLPFKFH